MVNPRIGGRTASDVPGLDIAEQRSWEHYLDAALRLYATLNRRLISAHKLPLEDFRLLQTLSRMPDGGARAGDLAVSLGELPCRLTRQTRRLEGQGLVRRCTSPEDGRGVVIVITTAGLLLARRAAATYAQNVRVLLLDCLSHAQVNAMTARCSRIAAPLGETRNSLQGGRSHAPGRDVVR